MKFKFGVRPLFQMVKKGSKLGVEAKINFHSITLKNKTYKIHNTLFVEFNVIKEYHEQDKGKNTIKFDMKDLKIKKYGFGNWSHSSNNLAKSTNKVLKTKLTYKEFDKELISALKASLFNNGTIKTTYTHKEF